jgi:Putative lumazine-binding
MTMTRPLTILFLLLFGAFASRSVAAQPAAADAAAITQTALDYIEGWYEGDAERMERALHPELAKRILSANPTTGAQRIDHMGALSLVQSTRRGGGKSTPIERRQRDVTILDVYENAASVKIVASDWVDYLHLVRAKDRWQIVNVLWELKPKPKPK